MAGFGKRKDGQAYPKTKRSGTKKKGSTSAGGKKISKSLAATKKKDREREQHEKHMEREYDSFLNGINEFGSGDIANAVSKANELNISGRELSDLVRSFADDTDTPLEDVDINYVIYDHELQTARNKIDSVLGYDFLNDFSGSTEFYTAGNYMATSFDYSEDAVAELQEKINEATGEQKDELEDDIFVKIFLEDVQVEIGK